LLVQVAAASVGQVYRAKMNGREVRHVPTCRSQQPGLQKKYEHMSNIQKTWMHIYIYIYYIVSYIFIDIKYIGSLDSTLDMLPNMCWIVLLFFGCQVAVKVQRPDVREQVTLDLFVVRQIASIGRVWWGDILRHSSAWYSCELCCCLVWFCLAFLWRIEISFSLFFKSWNCLSASPSVDFLTANLKFLSCRGPEQILCIPWRFICANWKVCLSAVD
jgi:hypothetical protein